jgi:hypothetical protein
MDASSGSATQAGPMDAHEAPAFQASAPATDADRDIGLVDGSNASSASSDAGDNDVESSGGLQPR